MYPTIPKYSRSPAQMSMGGHHHGNTSSSAHKFSLPLPPPAYLPIGVGVAANQQYASQSPASPYGTITKRHSSGSSGAGTEACRSYWSQPNAATIMYRNGRHYNKRKSAVELLAETKQFYIKSDVPLERLHQTNYRNTSTALNAAKRGRNSVDERDLERRYNPTMYRNSEMGMSADAVGDYKYGGGGGGGYSMGNGGNKITHTHQQTQQHHHSMGRHAMLPATNHLKNKFKTSLQAEVSAMKDGGGKSHCGEGHYKSDLARQYEFGPQMSGLSGKEFSSIGYESEAKNTRANLTYMAGGMYHTNYENSSGEEPLILTENYRPISPPAEYAADFNQPSNVDQRTRYNYQRSYSHSQEVSADNCDVYNINSHKSLPDLHSQISRHSPHSEILSCCSRGNRSIKSAGESSLNRDSGGSSGHYTHRSEPCYRQHELNDCDGVGGGGGGVGLGGGGGGGGYNTTAPSKLSCPNPLVSQKEYRRDSGSSTQHSANSYGGYVYTRAGECAECRCKMNSDYDAADLLLNFPTPEVPEAFQDDYVPPSTSTLKYKADESATRYATTSTSMQPNGMYSSGSMNHHHSQSHSPGGGSMLMQSPGSAPSIDEISPPPIQFKRQKCIRFKNRSRISLPSVSAAVHGSGGALNDNGGYDGGGGGGGGGVHGGGGGGYHHSQQAFVFPKCFAADGYRTHEKSQSLNEVSIAGMDGMSKSCFAEPLSELERFFDRLGLNDDKFYEIYTSATKRRRSGAGGVGGGAAGGGIGAGGGSGGGVGGVISSDSDNSSTVFFSDVSTVDSMRLPDSTETQPATETYRPSEPPSIVERNARIIKWLCNCRKVQNL